MSNKNGVIKFIFLLAIAIVSSDLFGEDNPVLEPDKYLRQAVEGVSHPDYCKDQFGNPISGDDCIKKSVNEANPSKHNKQKESQQMADAIKKSIEEKQKPKTLEKKLSPAEQLPESDPTPTRK